MTETWIKFGGYIVWDSENNDIWDDEDNPIDIEKEVRKETKEIIKSLNKFKKNIL